MAVVSDIPSPATHRIGRDRLAFTRVEIRKAPGISPGFTIDGLSPDITIVYGPNASGKSTTARAIQALIWPHPSVLRGHALAGSFTLDGAKWEIEADFARVTRSRDGEPADPPLLAPIDDRVRYTLGLPDLLASENQPLAQVILTEATGGFDLDAVVRERGYALETPTRLEAARDLDAAQGRLRDAEQAQDAVASDARQLAVLRERERAARQALTDTENIRRALALAQARLVAAQAERAANAFPAALDNVTGDEPARLGDLADRLAELHGRRVQLQAELDAAAAEADSTRLDGIAISDATLRALRASDTELRRRDTELTAVRRDLQTAIAERDSHQRRLAGDLSDIQMATLDTDGLRALAQLSHEYATIRTRRQARDEVERWIGGVSEPANVDELRQGLDYLNKRLQTPSATELGAIIGRARLAAYIGGVLAIAGAIWLAAFVHPVWIAFGLLGVLVILYAWKYALPASAQEAATYERLYAGLGLPNPESWTIPAIRRRVDDLNDQLRVAFVEREKADRWADLERERESLDRDFASAEARRASLVVEYGVAPNLGEESLTLLAENLDRWQSADARVHAADVRATSTQEERDELEASLREHLAGYGYGPGPLERQIDGLDGRFDTFRDASGRRDVVSQELESIVLPEIARLEAARAGIYERVGVSLGDDRAVEERIGQLGEFRAAGAILSEKADAARLAEAALATTPHLAEIAPEELRRMLERAEAGAAALDPAVHEIANVQTRIGDAKRKRDIERALARRDTARDALRANREEISARIAGHTLLSHVRAETRDAAMPIVFHRARELFTIITRGRYELQFEEGPPPAFTARETTTGLILALDQLSSGTRVQALMAIRLAFVENVEAGPKLPVLLDETLGNSDELRAGAIIDAAIEISRNGRQVFYFTAQGEEVARWRSRLAQIPDGDRPAMTVIDLAEVRRDAGVDKLPAYDGAGTIERLDVPAPNGVDRATYGAMLKVPPIDPWSDQLGNVHLWHLVHDNETLRHLLEQDIRTFGQLTGLARAGGQRALAILGVTREGFDEAKARARLIDAAISTWRIGRARPVSLRDIAETGLLLAATLAVVAPIVDAERGDAAKVLQRFRDELTGTDAGLPDQILDPLLEQLESWLIARGFMAGGEPVSPDEIRTRVLASVVADIDRDRLTLRDVDDVLRQIPTVVSPVSGLPGER